jgi:anti-anti-sigma factor
MISSKSADQYCVVLYPGESLDGTNAGEMSDAITKAQGEGYRYVIINLAAMKSISSAGAGSILACVAASRAMGGDIVLCHVPPRIRKVLEMLGLRDLLTLVSDEETARALCPMGSD